MSQKVTESALPRGKLTLMITWACDIACAHCCQEHLAVNLSLATCVDIIRRLDARQQITELSITGGEPFLRQKDLLSIVAFAGDRSISSGIVTNGRWSRKENRAGRILRQLYRSGLKLLVLSYDDFHAKFLTPGMITRLVEVASEVGLVVRIYCSGELKAQSVETRRTLEDLSNRFEIPIWFRDVLAIGHAAQPSVASSRRDFEDLYLGCPATGLCTIWPNGEVLPCCTAGTHRNLSVGRIYDRPVEMLVQKLHSASLFTVIRDAGFPQILERLPSEERQRIRDRKCSHACEVCFHTVGAPMGANLIRRMIGAPADVVAEVLAQF